MADLNVTIRRLLKRCGETRYRVSKVSGIDAGQLSRFARGLSDLTAETLQRLAAALGYEIVLRPKGSNRRTKR
ncbi:MAG: helix-turn-helix transcriptional regulator [Planctomycetes bacterium]|nr:helix-turn-helix transcriptional regulator [Planctomycetota bacterium]